MSLGPFIPRCYTVVAGEPDVETNKRPGVSTSSSPKDPVVRMPLINIRSHKFHDLILISNGIHHWERPVSPKS